MSRTVLIMAGGTGGHVFPALAIAEELRARGCRVAWLGTAAGIEARLVPAAGIPLYTVPATGLRGKHLGTLWRAPLTLWRALWQSWRLLRELRPGCVLGMGGYAAGPGGLVAWLTRVPLVIHEQNAVAGTTNRILARLARRVATAFPGAFSERAGATVTGNPVRAAIAALPEPADRGTGRHQPVRLLVLGGSLGARALNEAVPRALQSLPAAQRPAVWHQAGEAHAASVRDTYDALGVAARVEPFIEDMAEAYGWADLTVCRAGALTVSELTVGGLGAVLVPFPHAVDDHQTRNAEWMSTAGAAVLLPQDGPAIPNLSRTLAGLLAAPERLQDMARAARALGRPTAARDVATLCLEVGKGLEVSHG